MNWKVDPAQDSTMKLLRAVSRRITRCSACRGKSYYVNIWTNDNTYYVMMHPSMITYYDKQHTSKFDVKYPILFWAAKDVGISVSVNYNNQCCVLKTTTKLLTGMYEFGYKGIAKYRRWSPGLF